jgi:hypothetical protein
VFSSVCVVSYWYCLTCVFLCLCCFLLILFDLCFPLFVLFLIDIVWLVLSSVCVVSYWYCLTEHLNFNIALWSLCLDRQLNNWNERTTQTEDNTSQTISIRNNTNRGKHKSNNINNCFRCWIFIISIQIFILL